MSTRLKEKKNDLTSECNANDENQDLDSEAVRTALQGLDDLILAMGLNPDPPPVIRNCSPPPGFESPWPWLRSPSASVREDPSKLSQWSLNQSWMDPNPCSELFPRTSSILWENRSKRVLSPMLKKPTSSMSGSNVANLISVIGTPQPCQPRLVQTLSPNGTGQERSVSYVRPTCYRK